ncbi:ABC transporter substrate-binding protein [Crenobacter sp. SG2303]|uniref:ABC transporter substrate-binding protein n=1 Tax=Crenobacter oryzisoli TaxID=3056844 RepID=A0ABT7XP40_9NEIS|nr:ABC transporter substrate-binding protein [Crenobacter sp. SG2303]MDN0075324.1 ABC transporter substrate-binding protein [Crenobacter sp. SG2303]
MKKLAISAAIALVSTGVFAKDFSVIRFGTDPTYAPFESKAPDGKLVGFDIDLGNAICAKLHAKCVWVETAFDGMIPALKAKKFDGVLSSMNITEKREKEIAFSDKLYNAPSRLVVKKGTNLLPTVASLKGKRVGVAQGTIHEYYARAHWEPNGVTIVTYPNQDQVYLDLQSGRLDGSLQHAIEADVGFLKTARGHDFTFSGPALNDPKTLGTGSAVGLRKEDNELREAINKAIDGIIKDGTYKKIEQKYFAFDMYN